MYCVYCGTKLPDEARFCFMCGKGVEPDRGAKDNTASTNECNDEEAADASEAAGVETQTPSRLQTKLAKRPPKKELLAR